MSAQFISPDVAITTAHGAWVALYFWSLLAVLALASSIPHRRVSSTAERPDARAS